MIAFLKSELFAKFLGGFVLGAIGLLVLHPVSASTHAAPDSTTSGAIVQIAAPFSGASR
jgi:hypothetical protein